MSPITSALRSTARRSSCISPLATSHPSLPRTSTWLSSQFSHPPHTHSLFTSSRRLAATAAENASSPASNAKPIGAFRGGFVVLPPTPSPVTGLLELHGFDVNELPSLTPAAPPLLYSIFGFLSGSLVTGLALYYYTFDDYRASNAGLTEDIYVCHGFILTTASVPFSTLVK